MIIIFFLLSSIYLDSLAIISDYRGNRKEIECWVFRVWDKMNIKYSRNDRMDVKYSEKMIE